MAKNIYEDHIKIFSDNVRRESDYYTSTAQSSIKYIDRLIAEEDKNYNGLLQKIENNYQDLQKEPTDMHETADFLFVEGNAQEKFHKQFNALKFANASRQVKNLEEEINYNYTQKVDSCKQINEQYVENIYIEKHAKGALNSIENAHNYPVTLTKEEKSGARELCGLGIFLIVSAFLMLTLPFLVVSLTEESLDWILEFSKEESLSILLAVLISTTVFFVFGRFLYKRGKNRLQNKISKNDRQYEEAKQSINYKKEIEYENFRSDNKKLEQFNTLKENTVIAIELLERQREKALNALKPNFAKRKENIGYMPLIEDYELQRVVNVMEEGQASTYSEAINIVKMQIERERERQANAMQMHSIEQKLLDAQEKANADKLKELKRQADAAEEAARSARESAEASRLQAKAAGELAKSAQQAEKYGKKTQKTVEDIKRELYR